MTSSLESNDDTASAGLWIKENVAVFSTRAASITENVPTSFTDEYQMLAGVCASLSNGFMLLNSHERVTYSNERALRLLQINLHDHEALRTFDLPAYLLSLASDPQQVRSELERVWLHPEQEYALDLALASAAARWLRVRSFPVRDESGYLLGRGVLFEDITLERSAAESRAETLSMAAHELKTPLAIIKGCATTLLGGLARWDPTMQREMLQMIDVQSDRLYDVLNTLIDVWRFDAGAQPLHPTLIRMSDLLLQLINRWQKEASQHRFVLDVPDDLPLVSCDVSRIEQALNHIIRNAVTYSAPGRIVRIQLETNEIEMRISVADEGIGIASEHLERIFDRFYRVQTDQRRQEQEKGSGLGLSAARATIEAHKGKIWADSPGIGFGATFYVTLPLASQITQPLPVILSGDTGALPAVQVTGSLRQDRRLRVLLAECDSRLVRYVRANLEEQQYRVQTVNHGVQFFRQMDLEEPDLVILTTRLADVSGRDVLQRLREFSSVPVLMLSDDCDEDERVQLLDLGCDDLLLKPFGMKELLARTRALLRRQIPLAAQTVQQSLFTTGDLTIDYAQHLVTVRGQVVQLSRTEYKLLSTLAHNVGMVVTHELLLEKVWGPEYHRDIDFIWVYISRLRRKVEVNSRKPEYILTVPDVGYKLAKV